MWRGMTKEAIRIIRIRLSLLLIGKSDVEGALVGVEAGILHGQNPGRLTRLVVMGMPPAGRGREHGAGGPHTLDRVLHPALVI